MIGIDTNILIRYLTQDDPVQSAHATRIIERVFSEEDPGFISLVTIAETVWVLRSIYGLSDPAIAAVVERTLRTRSLAIQNERQVATAMLALKSGTASFDDALIGALGAWAGCTTTLTFDRKAARLNTFQLA